MSFCVLVAAFISPKMMLTNLFLFGFQGGMSLPDIIKVVQHIDFGTLYIKPAFVFIDEDDELVSYDSLQKMVHNQNLDQWKIHPVKKDKAATEVDMHHIVIDAASVGKYMWQEIVEVTITHLSDGQPQSFLKQPLN